MSEELQKQIAEAMAKAMELGSENVPVIANEFIRYSITMGIIGFVILLLLAVGCLFLVFMSDQFQESDFFVFVGAIGVIILTIASLCTLGDLIHVYMSPKTYIYKELIKSNCD